VRRQARGRPRLLLPAHPGDGLKDGDRLVDEEQFGPVLPIIKYRNVDEAIASANRLDAGLGASVWSTDVEKARQVASRIQAGTVWINQHGMIHPMVPFRRRQGLGLRRGVRRRRPEGGHPAAGHQLKEISAAPVPATRQVPSSALVHLLRSQ
jgi:acyl-CoA reductase-like NAD-dependent aldehyde dehydrogenase